MSRTHLMPSRMNLEDYSGGALPKTFTKRWGQHRWSNDNVDLPPVIVSYDQQGKVRWSQPLVGGHIDHWVSIANDAPTGSMGTHQIPDEVCLRLLCHVLTNWMPNDALPELGETLSEMYQFYRDRCIDTDVMYLPHFSESELEILKPVDRPLFQLAEE